MSMGHEGFLTLGKMAFDERMYGEFDLPIMMQVCKGYVTEYSQPSISKCIVSLLDSKQLKQTRIKCQSLI